MSATPNTLFLRLEGPLQAWGTNEGKFAIRRTADAPTKSGVFGLLCSAMGLGRAEAGLHWLDYLASLRMGVRIDRPGFRIWDFHTVGAKIEMRIAKLGEPNEPGEVGEERKQKLLYKDLDYDDRGMLTRREYLADASFLVALQGKPEIISQLSDHLAKPTWVLYLGRKSCPPSRPVNEHPAGYFDTLEDALVSVPLQFRKDGEHKPSTLELVLDWHPTHDGEEAPSEAEIHYDIPVSFQPPRHLPRFVIRQTMTYMLDAGKQTVKIGKPWRPPRARANYGNSKYKLARAERLVMDSGLCMVCKSPATTVQHVNYRRAGGHEEPEDLRALCRLCHDACTMLEYGAGMTMDRIDPCDPTWRDRILAKRAEIVNFRSLGQRSRKLKSEEENG